jgi:hypothetical protein
MGARLSALRVGRFLPPERFLVFISVRVWVDSWAIVGLKVLGQLKKSTSSGTRTGDLPTCSIVSQPTTLPRVPKSCWIKTKIGMNINMWPQRAEETQGKQRNSIAPRCNIPEVKTFVLHNEQLLQCAQIFAYFTSDIVPFLHAVNRMKTYTILVNMLNDWLLVYLVAHILTLSKLNAANVILFMFSGSRSTF